MVKNDIVKNTENNKLIEKDDAVCLNKQNLKKLVEYVAQKYQIPVHLL